MIIYLAKDPNTVFRGFSKCKLPIMMEEPTLYISQAIINIKARFSLGPFSMVLRHATSSAKLKIIGNWHA